MVQVKAALSDGGCRKPGCAGGILHRHHKRHEAMWFGIWSSRRHHERRWQKFIQRYHEFRKEDIMILCDRHHAEIHSVYDKIIKADRRKRGKGLYKYTWSEAEQLMAKLEKACLKWVKMETDGMSPNLLDARRAVKNILRD